MAEYHFTERHRSNGEVRLQWKRDDKPQDPLDFWIIPESEVEQAKGRVRTGEFDGE
jgi:hypothetical protein